MIEKKNSELTKSNCIEFFDAMKVECVGDSGKYLHSGGYREYQEAVHRLKEKCSISLLFKGVVVSVVLVSYSLIVRISHQAVLS